MADEVKDPPANQTDGQDGSKDTGKEGKSAEDMIAELKAEKERLERQVKDKEAFIGRQSTELGELRKIKEDVARKPIETAQEKNALVETVKKRLLAKGYDEDTASHNAEILVEESGVVVKATLRERDLAEIEDRILDGLENGELDPKAWEENQNEVMSEMATRKIPNTPSGYYRLLKKVYKDVIKKKADDLRVKEKEKSEQTRDGLIDGQDIPPKSRKEEDTSDDEKKYRDSIKTAGAPRSSVFF